MKGYRFPNLLPLMLAALAVLPATLDAQQWGYAVASSPATPSYNPNPAFSYNSANQPIEITRQNAGNYTVKFLQLGGGQGTVQVTEYITGTWECKALGWDTSGADFVVQVRCFTADGGAQADAAFSVLVVKSNISAFRQGYVWADQPNVNNYVAGAGKFFNSSGGNVVISRPDPVGNPGKYKVSFAGLGGGNELGNVQVTARGPGSETCTVYGWGFSGAAAEVEVRCFTTGGVPAATQFAVLLEIGGGAAQQQAYALGNQPLQANYAPDPQYAHGPGNITISKGADPGFYQVRFVNLGGGTNSGNAQATAYQVTNGEMCKAERWAIDPTDLIVYVRCLDAAGAPVEAKFSLLVEKKQ